MKRSGVRVMNNNIYELKNLDWNDLVFELCQLATSELAKQDLSQTRALATEEDALNCMKEIEQTRELIRLNRRPALESIDYYSTWIHRLKKKDTLKNKEIREVRAFCMEIIALKEILKSSNNSWLSHQCNLLFDASEPISAIDTLLHPNGDIRSDASETLYRLFKERENLSIKVQQLLDRLSKSHQMEPILQDRFVTNREGRWVLPIKSSRQNEFNGIIHDTSGSHQTVFMEPEEIIPLNNRLRKIELEINEEIDFLFKKLSEYLREKELDFEQAKQTMLLMDIRCSQAHLSEKLFAHPCSFDENHIQLYNLKHPSLILSGNPVISNTVELCYDTRRILLLSGPNAGGKTVLLKSIGLAAQMARCGLPICAQSPSVLPFFEEIIVSVGDEQNVDEQLSTFAAHLKTLNYATQLTGKKKLLLIDEICGATDPEEGSALARSFIVEYSINTLFSVITSHLGPLKNGWDDHSAVVNGSLEYDSNKGQPTFHFLMGVPGQSLALQTAKRTGVSSQIVNRALEYLTPEMKQRHYGLDEIETLKKELRIKQEHLTEEKKQLEQQKQNYLKLSKTIQENQEKELDKIIKMANAEIDHLIQNAKVNHLFKNHENLEKIKETLPKIIKSTGLPSSSQPHQTSQIESAHEFKLFYPPGSKVYIANLNREGIIQGEPNAKGEVPILSQSLRLSLHWNQLTTPAPQQNPTAKIIRKSHPHLSIALDHSNSSSIDLRGQKIEEALVLLDQFLDQSLLNQQNRIKIIHGHGTGLLKKAIRKYLSTSQYVNKWTANEFETDDDGLTYAYIDS